MTLASTLTELIVWNLKKDNTINLNDEKKRICYEEIIRAIAFFHHAFQKNKVKAGDRVAILMPRGVLSAVAIYATLIYGCTYVPIDIDAPPNRQRFIVNDVDPALIITEQKRDEEKNLQVNETIFSFDSTHMEVNFVSQDDLAAILYTSGSTGTPKGIAISHRAMLSFISWAEQTFSITKEDHIASLAPFHFDLSIFDLFVIWFHGSSLYFIPQTLTSFPTLLTEFLLTQQISIWYTVPSMLNYWRLKGNLIATPLPKLRTILFAGEIFPTPQLQALMQALKGTQFFNLFGPTETNVCTFYEVPKDTPLKLTLPIGHPITDVKIRIHPEKQTLLVKGPTVFSGYWYDGKLHLPTLMDLCWFDTNDLVSLNEKKELHYHGRCDRMVKISGYRVELGEIEAVLSGYPGIREAVVLNENSFLVACYASEHPLDVPALTRHLTTILPKYMQPQRYLSFPYLPRLSNGKLDLMNIKKEIAQ